MNNKKIIEEFRMKFLPFYTKGGYKGMSTLIEKHHEDLEKFWLSKLEAQKQEFTKTLNSGRKMFQLGKKKEKERIKRVVEGKRIKYGTTNYSQKVLLDKFNQALSDLLKELEL